jgi:hypothetical protein
MIKKSVKMPTTTQSIGVMTFLQPLHNCDRPVDALLAPEHEPAADEYRKANLGDDGDDLCFHYLATAIS